jgi:hypothetical protein
MTLSAQVGNLSQSINPNTQFAQVGGSGITFGSGTPFSDLTTGTRSFSVNVPSGSNTALFVAIGSESGSVSSVSYGGAALTKLWDQADGCNCGTERSSGWILINPSTGSNTLALTWTGSTLVGFAVPIYGVSQTGGVGGSWRTPVSLNDGGNGSATASANVSNAQYGDMVLDVLTSYSETPTVNASQTLLNQQNSPFGQPVRFGTSNKLATGATTMQWSMPPSTFWAMGAAALIPASGSTPPPPPTLSAPTISSFSSSPSSIQSGQSSTLSWSVSGNPTPTLSISGLGTVTGTSVSVSPTQTTIYTLIATNSQGSTNANTTVTVTASPPPPTPDTQAPSIPTGLSATVVSSSQINLSWNSSTDNIGVTGYDIYRGGSLLTSVTTNSYSDTGLTASTQYSYTVRSKDAAGNVSSQSSSVSATTQAGTPPPPSGSLTCTVTTANLSQSTVQTAINNAVDGAVVCVPAGSATWNGMAFSNSKGVTLAGASAWGGGTTTINPSSGGIGLNGTCSGTNTKLYRITGFTFNGGTNVVWHNAYNTGGCTMTNVRIDHNIFSNQSADSRILMFGDNSNNSYYYGVIDHNVVTNSSNVLLAEFYASNGSNAPAGPRGTINNMFFEDTKRSIKLCSNLFFL